MAGIFNIDFGGILGGVAKIADEVFTTDEERHEFMLKVMSLHEQGKLAQIAVNMQEAKSASMFVAGWRPFIGWTCGAIVAWHFVLFHVMVALLTAFGLHEHAAMLTPISSDTMMFISPVLMGMLGLRTFEKYKGVSTGEITPTVNRYGS